MAPGILLAHRRLLDVLRVGEDEADSLGRATSARLRLTVVMAATLGTAAAVSVSGLIGFVGIIVPHTVRLTAGASYRIVLPVSMIGGAAFLILADVAARTVQSPDEMPIGVITALAGRAVLPVHPPLEESPAGAGVISFDRVSVRYGTAQALAEVSEQVPAGEWLGVIGRNGTGKSTLLRAAARLVGHEGTITRSARQPTARMHRRPWPVSSRTSPSSLNSPPDMTALDYVLLGRTPHIGYLRTETAADREICAGLLDRLDLAPMAGRALGTLSGGELQRAGAGPGAGPGGARSCCSTSPPAPSTWAAGSRPWSWWTRCAGNGR